MLPHHENIIVRKLVSADLESLLYYLDNLSPQTKSRFGPHAFDRNSLIQFYDTTGITGFVAIDKMNNGVIAYAVLKDGIVDHEKERLLSYRYTGIENDCITYAPSVADNWQGKGIGKVVSNHLLSECRAKNIRKIILWGGVQSTNEQAVQFYKKLGFATLGEFEYNGLNKDMILEI